MHYEYWLYLQPQFTLFDAGMKITRILASMSLAIDPLGPDAPDRDWYRKQLQVDTATIGRACGWRILKLYHQWMNVSPPSEWLQKGFIDFVGGHGYNLTQFVTERVLNFVS